MNQAMIVGHIGRSELRKTGNGTPVLNFSVATNERRGKEEYTEWHNCVLFGDYAANIANNLTKGTQVFVCGHLQTKSYEDKDGAKKFKTEIVCQTVRYFRAGSGDSEKPAW